MEGMLFVILMNFDAHLLSHRHKTALKVIRCTLLGQL
jgi:hypothetical protein